MDCSGTTIVEFPTVSVKVGQAVTISGPLAGPAVLHLPSRQIVASLKGLIITAKAPGTVIVEVSGLDCGTADGQSQPAVCPLLTVMAS